MHGELYGTIAIIALFIGLRNIELADCISLTLGPVFVTILLLFSW